MIESRFEFKTFGFDTILNHNLPYKLKLIGRGKFNHLINTLTNFTYPPEIWFYNHNLEFSHLGFFFFLIF
jgi:hypothetical protein